MTAKGTKTPGGDESPLSLESVLQRPVVNSVPVAEFNEAAPVNEVEFEPAPDPAPQAQASQPDYEQQYEQEPKSLSPDDLAIIGVNLLDGLQSTLFALVRRNKVFEAAELEMINQLDHSANTLYQAGTKEAIAMAKFRKHKEAVAKLPFTAGEKQRLTDATIIYARTTEIKVSPFTGLLLAYSEVLGTRAFNIMGDND
ncbi:hypothetical protein IDJ77_11285 [Mucilaginibacter sp. ZT4R22]|uniref:Uncharacterized protein n=1 Tax=Mucilaginibacter pankratovii TaxID=2772110 RepID=A0ABR7WQ11_9SPHI|nr:hypothetical protein [Mucilaginibacter pankratovii]MBD1364392.1 hypothetical protein [Mucilaginibacter pankratovii]